MPPQPTYKAQIWSRLANWVYPVEGMTYIYVLRDPETLRVRYVGKSINPKGRYSKRLCEAKKGSHIAELRWVKKLLSTRKLPVLQVIELVSNDAQMAREIHWIARYKQKFPDLLNITDGGEGNIGWHPSAATCRKISKANKGYRHTPEARARMVLARTVHVPPPDIELIGRKNSGGASKNLQALPERLPGLLHSFGVVQANKKTSIYPGVSFNKRKQRYIAQFRYQRKRTIVGQFETAELAYAAYLAALKGLNLPVNLSKDLT